MRPTYLLHGFGLKKTSLQEPVIRDLLHTADSMAWSFAARREGRNANDWREAKAFIQDIADRIRNRCVSRSSMRYLIATYIAAMVAANLLVWWLGPWALAVHSFVLIGLDLTLRDVMHDRLTRWQMLAVVLVGGALLGA
jgi:fatty acid desaturase